MKYWEELNTIEYKSAWDFVYGKLSFKSKEKSKLIALPTPCVCFDISNFYDDGFQEELYDDLHEFVIRQFQVISKGEKVYALNWQHDCYFFYPKLSVDRDEFDEWLVPVFPNGDYIFFLTSDFTNGIFADGINLKISFWGKEIVDAIEMDKPKMLIKNISCG